jgi:predicted transcriptional regulator
MPSSMRKQSICFTVEPLVEEKLRELAAADDRTLSFLTNRALKEWLAERGEEPPPAEVPATYYRRRKKVAA